MDRNIPSGGAADGPQLNYLDRLYKLIPIEITGAFTAISTLADPVNLGESEALKVIVLAFFVLLVCVPLYLSRLQGVSNVRQLIVSTISFPIWAANISSTTLITNFPSISGMMLGVLLILWTIISPLIMGRQ